MFALLLTSVATITYAAFGTMGHFQDADDSLSAAIVTVVGFFIVPFLIAYTIAANYALSRTLIVVYSIGLVITLGIRYATVRDAVTDLPFGMLVGTTIAVCGWLYLSPRARVYYALVAGRPVPDSLLPIVDSLTEPTRTERLARRLWVLLEPLAPFAIFIIAMFIVYAGFSNLMP